MAAGNICWKGKIMSRIFKFRVWDKTKKRFIDTKHYCWGDYYDKTGNARSGESGELLMDFEGNLRVATYSCGNGDNSADSVFINVSNNDDFVIQQFTSLKDKNGVEIYEGDIVRDLDGENGEIRFDWGGFIIKINNMVMPFYSILETQGFVQPRLVNPKCYEIIGNIFEHPELIKL